MYCPPLGYHTSVMQQSLQGPTPTVIKVISRKGGQICPVCSRKIGPQWCGCCLAEQHSDWSLDRKVLHLQYLKPWKAKSENVEQMAAQEGLWAVVSVSGEGCCPNLSHWSNGWSESYPPSMWTEPSPWNTHTRAKHNEPHSYSSFLLTSMCAWTVLYYSTFTSALNMGFCLFIRSTLNSPLWVKHLLFKNTVRLELMNTSLIQCQSQSITKKHLSRWWRINLWFF